MGLGKTIQALAIAYYYKNEWPLLIACPSSICLLWIEEIEKWLPDIEPHQINLVKSGIDVRYNKAKPCMCMIFFTSMLMIETFRSNCILFDLHFNITTLIHVRAI